MTTIPVIWWPERGFWDQALMEDILARQTHIPPDALSFSHRTADELQTAPPGGIVMAHVGPELVEDFLEFVGALEWSFIIFTGDEEATFPFERLPRGPRRAVWAQYASLAPGIDRAIPLGYAPEVAAALRAEPLIIPERTWDVSFVGQNTHPRRNAVVAATLRAERQGLRSLLISTDRFGGVAGGATNALSPVGYAGVLQRTKLALCPSGPVNADTFRAYEALEAGALPVVDSHTPEGPVPETFWEERLPDSPLPEAAEWGSWLDRAAPMVLSAPEGWQAWANEAGAWWEGTKRSLALSLDRTARACAGMPDASLQGVTTLITASPTPSDPDLAHLSATIASIRAQQLGDAPIVVVFDGVRPEQAERAGAYEELIARALCAARSHRKAWRNVLIVRQEEWGHQANAARAGLEHVLTDLVLFVEHDTPLVGRIEWAACEEAVRQRLADVVRFHHEAWVLPEHEHLMVGEPEDIGGVRMRRTRQWSQRPHLARAEWYRTTLEGFFGRESRTMIEDVLHGVAQHSLWEWAFRLWLYHEPDADGSIKRSGHLDARGADEKYPMLYAYDGSTPDGAPAPTKERA